MLILLWMMRMMLDEETRQGTSFVWVLLWMMRMMPRKGMPVMDADDVDKRMMMMMMMMMMMKRNQTRRSFVWVLLWMMTMMLRRGMPVMMLTTWV